MLSEKFSSNEFSREETSPLSRGSEALLYKGEKSFLLTCAYKPAGK